MKKWYAYLHQFDELDLEEQVIVYRSFYHYAYRDIYFLVQNHATTEDLIQESFCKILSSMKKYAVSKTLPWIRQVVRNMTIDYLRKINKERHTTTIDDVRNMEWRLELATSGSDGMDQQVEDKIRDELLHEAIMELKPAYRLIITLYYIYELPSKEIGKILRISEFAVNQRLFRARKKLLQQFLRKWDRL